MPRSKKLMAFPDQCFWSRNYQILLLRGVIFAFGVPFLCLNMLRSLLFRLLGWSSAVTGLSFSVHLHPGWAPSIEIDRTTNTEDQKNRKTSTWRQLGKSTTRKNVWKQQKRKTDVWFVHHLSLRFFLPFRPKNGSIYLSLPLLFHLIAQKKEQKSVQKWVKKLTPARGSHLYFPFTCPSQNFCKHRQSQFLCHFWWYR